MINLNEPVKATQGFTEFEKLPDGEYIVEVKEFKEWKEFNKQNARVKARDENNKIIKDQYETLPTLKFYIADIKYEVLEGEHKGRIIFGSLSTHPDQAWTISRFVYAVDLDDVTPAELNTLSVGSQLKIDVKFVDSEYTKTTTDKDTGLDVEEVKTTVRTYINKYSRI